jgi:putative PIN family toxin of toxin-antitoxin system
MYKIVIDANVWIKYARSKDIAPLLNRVVAFNLLPVANNYLLSEIFTAVVENEWMTAKVATNMISFIRKVVMMTTETAVYGLSPDPKDNYLFDLAVQNNCVFIISDDVKLIEFAFKPIPVHTSGWFLKTFSLYV